MLGSTPVTPFAMKTQVSVSGVMMRVVHQFAPPMSAMIGSLAGVTAAQHIPRETRWDLPTDADVLIVYGSGDAEADQSAPRPAGWPGTTRLVQLASAGVDEYPLWLFDAPRIATASGTTARPIAEYALAVMLAHAKRLDAISLKAGDIWPTRDANGPSPLGTLEGRTLGLVGVGAIGSRIAALAGAFGMTVLASRASDRPSDDPNVTIAPLADVLRRADHLVIAAPITDATRGLIDAGALASMKDGAHLVNIARGAIVDTDALLAELDAGRLWATLDVTEPEPLPPGHRLIGHPRARVTPHLSWSSPETARRIFERLSENIRRLGADEPLLGAFKDA